ncbi:MAG: RNA polymerase sigma factor [Salinibacterium sp.]|nr:RNA polymerase sigma factor [Micrococcales bacterium]MCB1281483.1 RNA polymerase sigma factor [Salinibacterium sp.]
MSIGNPAFMLRRAGDRLQVRDRSAEVSDLVERESGKLLNYFLRRTSNHEDAADLLGETLLIVWRRERSIPEDETQSRMWMYGIARKVLAGQRRGNRRRTALRQRLAEELNTPQPDHADDEMLDVVRSAIQQLDAIDQEIVRLHYWDGFSLVEAASLLGLRPATVRSRHARIRSKLRIKFETGLEH